uniref:Putative secreted protein n=1 Tax=Rhipicephalus microplus TaxID=6941 RepID=A0A6M2DE18_RHIMP
MFCFFFFFFCALIFLLAILTIAVPSVQVYSIHSQEGYEAANEDQMLCLNSIRTFFSWHMNFLESTFTLDPGLGWAH